MGFRFGPGVGVPTLLIELQCCYDTEESSSSIFRPPSTNTPTSPGLGCAATNSNITARKNMRDTTVQHQGLAKYMRGPLQSSVTFFPPNQRRPTQDDRKTPSTPPQSDSNDNQPVHRETPGESPDTLGGGRGVNKATAYRVLLLLLLQGDSMCKAPQFKRRNPPLRRYIK